MKTFITRDLLLVNEENNVYKKVKDFKKSINEIEIGLGLFLTISSIFYFIISLLCAVYLFENSVTKVSIISDITQDVVNIPLRITSIMIVFQGLILMIFGLAVSKTLKANYQIIRILEENRLKAGSLMG